MCGVKTTGSAPALSVARVASGSPPFCLCYSPGCDRGWIVGLYAALFGARRPKGHEGVGLSAVP
jgi:hypothetical protein